MQKVWSIPVIFGVVVATNATAQAQTEAEAAAQNMQLATEICLRDIRNAQQIPGRLAQAGFSVGPGLDSGTYEFSAFGVNGLIDASGSDGFCSVQSTRVPLALASAIGQATADRLYPGAATPGAPSSPGSGPAGFCDGLTFWDARPIITVSYAQAGNSGECIDDGTSAILID